MTVRRLVAAGVTTGALSAVLSAALYVVAIPSDADDIRVCVGISEPSGGGRNYCLSTDPGDLRDPLRDIGGYVVGG